MTAAYSWNLHLQINTLTMNFMNASSKVIISFVLLCVMFQMGDLALVRLFFPCDSVIQQNKKADVNSDSHSGHFVAPWSDVSLVSDVGSVEGLAYHKGWDTLYWTSSTTSTITRQTVDQSQAGAISRQAVVTLSEEDHPHVLALDECQRSVVFPIMHFSPFAHASVFITYVCDFSSEYYLLGI